jgi:autophagy-related protein 18
LLPTQNIMQGTASSQRQLQIINANKEKLIEQYNYPSAVLAVKLNRDRMVVVLEATIYIYNMRTCQELHTIDGTYPNYKGVCALACCRNPNGAAAAGTNNFFAYPGAGGAIHIYDVHHQKAIDEIKGENAHGAGAEIACMAFSPDGDKLATADTVGTTIVIFSTPAGGLPPSVLYKFSRGSTSAAISCIAFNGSGSMLCVASNKETIHIFKCEEDADGEGRAGGGADGGEHSATWASWGMNLIKGAGETLTTVGTKGLDAVKGVGGRLVDRALLPGSFAKARLRKGYESELTVCAFNRESTGIMAVTGKGYLLKFTLPTTAEAKGECGDPLCHPFPEEPSTQTNGESGGGSGGGGNTASTGSAGARTTPTGGNTTATAMARAPDISTLTPAPAPVSAPALAPATVPAPAAEAPTDVAVGGEDVDTAVDSPGGYPYGFLPPDPLNEREVTDEAVEWVGPGGEGWTAPSGGWVAPKGWEIYK